MHFYNFKTIFSLLFLVFGFALVSNIRMDIIYLNPDQMLLTEKHVAYEIFNESYQAAVENISMIFQYNYSILLNFEPIVLVRKRQTKFLFFYTF